MTATVTFPDGTAVAALGQGTWFMGEHYERRAAEIKALRTGIDLGMTAIDTAEMYGDGHSERLVGEAIAGRRDSVFLISKVLPQNADYEGTQRACERSLQRLGTDRLDLYLLHWAGPYPPDETAAAMQQLVSQGKILRWGVSNMDVDEMENFTAVGGTPACATDEILYNLTRRGAEFDLLPWCRCHRLPVIAYSPIEQGRLIGNKAIAEVAARHGATAAQIALAWVLRRPGLMAIPKAGTEAHVRENFGALSIKLTCADLAILDSAFHPPHRKMPLESI